MELVRNRLDHGDLPTSEGARPHLTVIADLATLRLESGSRAAELDWGLPVAGETARRIACDAEITPIVLDANGDPLHVGHVAVHERGHRLIRGRGSQVVALPP